jgi:hypothetical protein
MMKTALAIDSLILRDDAVFLLEMLLNLYPDSEIYCIAHKRGAILGSIETRPIVSSFLTHKAKDVEVFKRNFWMMPSAVKAIPLHSSIEKVIVISRGFIHGMTLPSHVQRFLYILDWDLTSTENLGWQQLFLAYVNNWREKALQNFHHISVSSQTLKTQLELPNAEIISPTFRTEEYPFVRDEDHNFHFSHHLILTHGLTKVEFRAIVVFLLEKKEAVKVMGPDSDFMDVKKDFPDVEFAGDHCEATTALYSHQAKVIWSLGNSSFPSKAFGALATGRPAIVRDSLLNREFLTQGALFLSSFEKEDLEKIYTEVESLYLAVDRKILRRLGLKWNERLFKSRMSKFTKRD